MLKEVPGDAGQLLGFVADACVGETYSSQALLPSWTPAWPMWRWQIYIAAVSIPSGCLCKARSRDNTAAINVQCDSLALGYLIAVARPASGALISSPARTRRGVVEA